MKNLVICTFLLLIIFLYSCNRNPESAGDTKTDKTTLSQCYFSALGTDSASLVLNDRKGIISGNLDLYFSEKSNLMGEISGSYKGDTLYADYTYRVGKGTEYFKNPLVFLRKDGKFYQGYGEIISTFGRTHFKDGAPIDFNKGFVFSAVDCK